MRALLIVMIDYCMFLGWHRKCGGVSKYTTEECLHTGRISKEDANKFLLDIEEKMQELLNQTPSFNLPDSDKLIKHAKEKLQRKVVYMSMSSYIRVSVISVR